MATTGRPDACGTACLISPTSSPNARAGRFSPANRRKSPDLTPTCSGPTMHRNPNGLSVRRQDLILRPIGAEGQFVVKDPKTGAFFHMGDREQFLLNRLDGQQTLQTVRRAYERQFDEPLTADDLDEFLATAAAQNLVTPASTALEPKPSFRPST